jgi:glutathione synthase/RimK-type ligase-like ATP-grasp enzyme
MHNYFHLAIAWDWELDRDFVAILERQMHDHHLSSYSISHHNTHETLRMLNRGELRFGAFLDRASDADDRFVPLARAIQKSSALCINPPETSQHAIDKATMHLEFLDKGIEVPFTIIISPFNKKKEVELTLSDIANLGRPFIIKPANTTGGGIGVIIGAETLRDVIESRQHHKNDKYLLQQKIAPIFLAGRKAWFRVFYIFGLILPCWWDDETHLYHMITKHEVTTYGLRPLMTITRRIWEVCKLDFFSTEIAATGEKRFVAVDYVNDICDMRLQSKHRDGVPDLVVTEICRRIARHLKSELK